MDGSGKRVGVVISLDGWAVQSATRIASVGAHVVVVTTAIASPRAPITLTSTYVGARDIDTQVTRLLQQPAGVSFEQREVRLVSVIGDDRNDCLADHLDALLSTLIDLGFEPSTRIEGPRPLPEPMPQSIFISEKRGTPPAEFPRERRRPRWLRR
ncbi:hypothetical protein OJ997_25250 [Solirubrobacter phytolaccae]|uniref:Uncharacterized protein n=1 Tax=Solirubrobacter phytolaccae TaxID=1404360 RepID=A0A9X3NBL0_9ACTN|nr:hypothetical protein [Solirubrobacter phytolaccae]MDA0183640.1 hypothetical protein [Solirubrobacter phytolaccae]